ncbi:DUF2059 domain-containing protein [Sphingomicrobium sediminis]|uniref:DUF2059 domain-containing protein n=1 Tax=Sphingomicrobium sediminis TaxID=2950949 RepID=A0A9X2EHI6_9SPHN|nr:DUF2059 domain-containing protein [Sphingomicrobium sediminis]MCM8558148.1 DUF2059 domain-containing protein [Sphingomicrobium sediminis]
MRFVLVAFLAALTLGGCGNSTDTAEPGALESSNASAAALELAQAAQPEDIFLDGAEIGFRLGLANEFGRDPTYARRDDFAEIMADIHERAWPVYRESLADRMPELYAGLAEVYDDQLSVEEMDRIQTFLESETGEKFLRMSLGAMEGLSPDAIDGIATSSDLEAFNAQTGMNAAAQMSAAEQAEIVEFERENYEALTRVAGPANRMIMRFGQQPPSAEVQARLAEVVDEIKAERGL